MHHSQHYNVLKKGSKTERDERTDGQTEREREMEVPTIIAFGLLCDFGHVHIALAFLLDGHGDGRRRRRRRWGCLSVCLCVRENAAQKTE